MPSGYFSSPSSMLDPALFDGDVMHSDVRQGLLDALYRGLRFISLRNPEEWTYAWLAGSGASYQWSADRGNGDLDILFGVDYPTFLECNPQFPRLSVREVAGYIDRLLSESYWPKTSAYEIHGKTYEVTEYWNPGTTTSIDAIHPYAAYSLTRNEWDVRPPDLPVDPHTLYPTEWYDWTDRDYRHAQELSTQYHSKGDIVKRLAGQSARVLLDDIHLGRKAAFSDTGKGYGDWHNFRHQRAKETGVYDLLKPIADGVSNAEPEIPGASDVLIRAAMNYTDSRYGH